MWKTDDAPAATGCFIGEQKYEIWSNNAMRDMICFVDLWSLVLVFGLMEAESRDRRLLHDFLMIIQMIINNSLLFWVLPHN